MGERLHFWACRVCRPIHYLFPNILKYKSYIKNSVDFFILLSLFVIRNFRGSLHVHLSKCWKGTWSEKSWEPLPYMKLCLKPSPKCLRSRKHICPFVWVVKYRYTHHINPSSSPIFIPTFDLQPPGCDLPRNAWVHLNRLRTGFSLFVVNMKTMGLCGSDLCECGKMQTAHHILHDCTKFKSPCHIYEVDNPALLEYLVKSRF